MILKNLNQQREPKWNEGTVSEAYYGFFIGTSQGENGDPGSGIFDYYGRFLGISVAKKDFKFDDQEIAEVANHHSDTKIIDVRTIVAISKIVGTDPFLPQQKK
ncbi:unnamed protein product [Caenorhabditis auriculariae]|uniref:Uncharacterized protein n=1 Tax=Caenorhabditis auriculariae TaxID=2777116 RepID=A0A8S1HW88_9PELO|nr:unnamed protein product [Caenorhabditis auriculariae]